MNRAKGEILKNCIKYFKQFNRIWVYTDPELVAAFLVSEKLREKTLNFSALVEKYWDLIVNFAAKA